MIRNSGMSSNRAQSEIIGLILLYAIVMLSIAAIMLFGQGSIEALDEEVKLENMKNDFAVLGSQMSTSALGDAERQRVEIGLEGGELTSNPDTSWLRVNFDAENGGEEEIVNTTIGNIEYSLDDRVLAYEGGGVWMRQTDVEGSAMVSPPDFYYRDLTLTVPVYNITSERRVSGEQDSFSVASGDTEVKHPESSGDNPLDEGDVSVTVKSEYYRGWASFFRDRTEGTNVTTDDDRKTATMEIEVPGPGDINQPIYAGGGNLHVDDGSLVDSYSGAEYEPTNSNPEGFSCDYDGTGADVSASGAVSADSQVCLYGDIIGSDDVASGLDIKSDVYIHGDANSGQHLTVETGGFVGGDVRSNKNAEIYNDAGVGGTIHVSGNNKDANVDDRGTVGGDIHATGAVNLRDDVEVNGSIYAGRSVELYYGVEMQPGEEIHASDVTCRDRTSGLLDGVTIYIDNINQKDADCEDAGADFEEGPSSPNPEEPANNPAEYPEPDIPNLDENDHPCGDQAHEIVLSGGEDCTIDTDSHASEYSLDDLVLSDDATLTIDGEVNMTVTGNGGTELADGSEILVDGGLTIHTDADTYIEGNVTTDESGGHGGPHDSTAIQINVGGGGNPDMQLDEAAEFTGVLYAPEINNFEVDDDAEVYGAVIAGKNNADIEGSVHYDNDLGGLQTSASFSQVYYLHVTENEILMEG